MYELLYTSVSIYGFSDSALLDLLNQARDRNKTLAVTGMLLYDNREFIQLLEGPEESVKDVYSSIQRDNRHTSVETFYEGNTKERAFSDWSMAFMMFTEEEKKRCIPGYEPFELEQTPRNLIQANPNAGKELFLLLRNQL